MTKSNGEDQSFDALKAWREVRDAGMEAWAKAMVEAVRSEDYAKASGVMLDTCLTASIPFHDMVEKTMGELLQQLNLPSRSDFTVFAERLTNVEMRLDDMDAKLDELLKRSAPASESAPKRPEARGKAKGT